MSFLELALVGQVILWMLDCSAVFDVRSGIALSSAHGISRLSCGSICRAPGYASTGLASITLWNYMVFEPSEDQFFAEPGSKFGRAIGICGVLRRLRLVRDDVFLLRPHALSRSLKLLRCD